MFNMFKFVCFIILSYFHKSMTVCYGSYNGEFNWYKYTVPFIMGVSPGELSEELVT